MSNKLWLGLVFVCFTLSFIYLLAPVPVQQPGALLTRGLLLSLLTQLLEDLHLEQLLLQFLDAAPHPGHLLHLAPEAVHLPPHLRDAPLQHRDLLALTLHVLLESFKAFPDTFRLLQNLL